MAARTFMPSRLVAALLAGLSLAMTASAKDFGVQGKTWDITEVDVRQLMVESAARANWSQAQEALQDSAQRYLDRLPGANLPVASSTHTAWVDPSMTLASDIQAPVRNPQTGQWTWQPIYRKGEQFNPLSTHRPTTAMLFFDARDEAQVQFVAGALQRNALGIVPVETSGANPAKLTERLSRPVFHANEPLLARFEVSHVPALVYPGDGEHALFIGRTAFASPYQLEALERVWPQAGARQGSATTFGARRDAETP